MKTYRPLFSAFTLLAFLFIGAPAVHAEGYSDAAGNTAHITRAQMNLNNEQEAKELYLMQQAFTAGLQTVEAHQYTNTLTEQDQEIIQLLDVKIPGVLNRLTAFFNEEDEEKAQNLASGIEQELLTVSEELARKIIANQTLYPQPENWQAASNYALMMAMGYAMMTEKIDPELSSILTNAAFQEMLQMMLEE